MFSLFFSFSGRLRRRSYWGVLLTWQAIRIGMPILWYSLMSMPGSEFDIQDTTYDDPAFYEATNLYLVLSLIAAVSMVSATWRRLHDINANGFWAILSLIPVIDFFTMVILGCIDSQPGTNRYGVNPKGEATYYIPGANEEVRTKELLDLVKLYEKGYLTEEEFKKQKAKLLGE